MSLLFADTCVPPPLLQCRLDLIENLYLFSDWPGADPNEVLPPGETTAILYRAARSACPAGRVLDLGCGSGTLALLLAPHVRHATGTDINPRAITLSRLNAEVNGIDNVEFRVGSLYQPIDSERFDLIVCQPPYVPRTAGQPQHLFLHGGERGDELAREIIAGLATHLTPPGRALIFSDWPLTAGERLQDRIPTTMKATLLASPPLTLEAYSSSYGDDLPGHFASLGVTGIRQCLAIFEHGEGVTMREVLPHQWT
jgi:SAM-dependent methyltransferase